MTDLAEASAREFSRLALPSYHGPCVTIRINSGGYEYTVSKPLICRYSKYFSAMFTNEFKEGQKQEATLEEVEGVLSAQSFEALLQWLYLGRVKFDLELPEDEVSAAIELARLADMCLVPGLEDPMARYIKDILIANPEPETFFEERRVDINTYCLTTEHMISATSLPEGHAVRHVLAAASVEGYLRDENHKFAQEARAYPTFGADVLHEVRKALNTLKVFNSAATVEDPISGKRLEINDLYGH